MALQSQENLGGTAGGMSVPWSQDLIWVFFYCLFLTLKKENLFLFLFFYERYANYRESREGSRIRLSGI
jgi:hypothetical protein